MERLQGLGTPDSRLAPVILTASGKLQTHSELLFLLLWDREGCLQKALRKWLPESFERLKGCILASLLQQTCNKKSDGLPLYY